MSQHVATRTTTASASQDTTRRPLTVSILGDSYSTFEGWMTPDSNRSFYSCLPNQTNMLTEVEDTWWHMLFCTDTTQYVLLQNNSYSGSPISNMGYKNSDATTYSFCTRLASMAPGMDIIIVQGGVNDSWASVPMGEYKYKNITPKDLNTFRPALAYVLSTLQDKHPQARLFFLLCDGLSTNIKKSSKEVCQHYGVPVIASPVTEKESGHPTAKGQKTIAHKVLEVLNEQIGN